MDTYPVKSPQEVVPYIFDRIEVSGLRLMQSLIISIPLPISTKSGYDCFQCFTCNLTKHTFSLKSCELCDIVAGSLLVNSTNHPALYSLQF